MVIIKIIETVILISLFFVPFWIFYGFYPWLMCDFKKYECELQKAQRVSRIIIC